MSRALRRHPSAKQTKARGKAAVAGWRPRFFMDIIGELRKVVWPSRQEAMHLTLVVILVSALLGALLGGIDIGFGWLIDNTLLR
jgi:preprotein translocase subunit SecE